MASRCGLSDIFLTVERDSGGMLLIQGGLADLEEFRVERESVLPRRRFRIT